MFSSSKCILLALVGSVLLSAALANQEQQPTDQMASFAAGAMNTAKKVAQETENVASSAVSEAEKEAQNVAQGAEKAATNAGSGIYGLGSKIFGTVRRGAASIYSHLPFISGQSGSAAPSGKVEEQQPEATNSPAQTQVANQEKSEHSEPEQQQEASEKASSTEQGEPQNDQKVHQQQVEEGTEKKAEESKQN